MRPQVRPYSSREALGLTWLKNVDDGRLMKESYVAHVDVGGSGGGDAVVMLTLTRIRESALRLGSAPSLTPLPPVFVRTLRLKVAWEVPLSDLSSISLESEGIALVLRGGVAGPFLALSDLGTRNFMFRSISRVVQAYNAQHTQ